MGTPATMEEQKALALVYCPDVLERLKKAEQNLATMKYRRHKRAGGIAIHETIGNWVLRMRREIASEMEVFIWDEEA